MKIAPEKNIFEIIEALNGIKLNHPELVGIATDFSSIHFKNRVVEAQVFDKFWGEGLFINHAAEVVRESIVLAMSSLTLSKNIKFDMIFSECIDMDQENKVVNKLVELFAERSSAVGEDLFLEKEEHKNLLKDFFYSLRSEVFMRIFVQNRDLQKTTKIPKEELKERQELFFQYIK
jgi:hypothetical protein